jgi:hypothetical protein
MRKDHYRSTSSQVCLLFNDDENFRDLCRFGKLHFGDGFKDSSWESMHLIIFAIGGRRSWMDRVKDKAPKVHVQGVK